MIAMRLPTCRKRACSIRSVSSRKIGMVDQRTFRELSKALALTLFPFLSLK